MTAVEDVRPAIARFRGANGRVTGAGCLLPGGRILTCAHVVNAALGRPGDAADRPAAPLSVEFPHAGGGATTATVLLDGGWNGAADVAVLALDTAPPAAPLRLLEPRGVAADLWSHPIRAWGFPDGSTERGLSSNGELRDRLTNGTFQINPADDHSPFIGKGYSGGPVWDDALGGVVGIVVQAQAQLNVAACLPAAALIIACPALADCIDVFDPLAEYCAAVAAKTAHVDLRGVPLPKTHDGRRIPLNLPLDRVYVRMRAVREERRRDEKERRKLPVDAQEKATDAYLRLIDRLGEYFYTQLIAERSVDEPVDPEAALHEQKRLVLLGPPGAGKSTLLRFLARRAAANAGPTPLLVRLDQYATHLGKGAVSLIDFALEGLPSLQQKAVRAAVARGDVLWLLDALDETREAAPDVLEQLRDLRGQLVLTSRPLGYEPGAAAELAHYELQPLGAGEIVQFLGNWFGALAEAQGLGTEWAAEQVQATQARLADRPGLRQLLGNPLMLTFVAVLAGKDPAEELPYYRTELYRRYLEELLDSWERERWRRTIGASARARQSDGLDSSGQEQQLGEEAQRTLGPLTGPSVRYALRDGILWLGWWLHLAYYGSPSARTPLEDEAIWALADYYQVAADYAVLKRHEWLTVAETVVDFWKEAELLDIWPLLTDNGLVDFLGFRHLTFQEYAAAVVLAEAWGNDRERAWAFLQPRLHVHAWREPLLLLGGLLHSTDADVLLARVLKAGSPYEHVLRRDLRAASVLAGQLRRAGGVGYEELTEQLVEAIRSARLQPLQQTHLAIIESVRLPGNIAVQEALLETLKWGGQDSRDAVATALGRIGDATVCTSLLALLNNENNNVRRTVAGMLGSMGGDAAVTGLLGALRDTDDWVRLTAARELGQIGHASAVRGFGLLAALHDKSFWVREAAAEALGHIGDAAAVPELLAALKRGGGSVRFAASRALAEIGDAAAISGLLIALRDENDSIRSTASGALIKIGSTAVVSGLLIALSDEDDRVRWEAANALGEIGDATVVPNLLTTLRDVSDSVRQITVKALGQIGDVVVVPGLVAALRDKSPQVRATAIFKLSRIGDAAALSALLAALRDKNNADRWMVADALGVIGDVVAVTALLALLKDENCSILDVHNAVRALGEIGDTRAVPVLITLLQNGDSMTQVFAAGALAKIADGRAVPRLVVALKDENAMVREAAARALAGIGDATAVSGLLAALRDEVPYVRREVAHALGRLGDRAVMPALLAALKDDKSQEVRQTVALTLVRFGKPAIPGLLVALHDKDSFVRQATAEALGKIGDVTAVPGLLIALKDDNGDVRKHAIEALDQIGDVTAVPELLAMLDDPDSAARHVADEALKRMAKQLARVPLIDAANVLVEQAGQLSHEGFDVLEAFVARLATLNIAILHADDLLLPRV